MSTILFHFVLFICVTHASLAPALLPPISRRPSSGMFAHRTAATHRRRTTTSEHSRGSAVWPRQVRSFCWCGFVFVPLTPRWCCGAVVGQRPPIKASGTSLYGHSRQQRAAGHGDAWPSTTTNYGHRIRQRMQREHDGSSTAVGPAPVGGGGAGTRPRP